MNIKIAVIMKLKSLIVFSLFIVSSFSVFGSSVQKFILNAGGNDRFPLVASGNPVSVVEDSTDYPGVLRAVNNLRNDINNVTGFVPFLSKNKLPKEKQLLIIGTLGKNAFINQLVESGKIDAAELSGKNEKYLIQTIAHPFQGVDEALVIAGSDKRGTIYGVYELSAQIGVSPWYYWADVPVKKQKIFM
jgi:Glycosyl hydrolase family 67 N-terminus.